MECALASVVKISETQLKQDSGLRLYGFHHPININIIDVDLSLEIFYPYPPLQGIFFLPIHL